MYLYFCMYNIHRSGVYLLFPCHSAACIDTSEKDVQAMTGYDSPDYLAQTWWMRRDSSKCRVEFAALEKFRHPKSAKQPRDFMCALVACALHGEVFLRPFATRLDTDNALYPRVMTRNIRQARIRKKNI